MSSVAEICTDTSVPSTRDQAGASLVERAEGLSRATVMKDILGPHLDEMLRPIYNPRITAKDGNLDSLEGEFPVRVLRGFANQLGSLLRARFRAQVKDGLAYQQFLELSEQRPDILFYAEDPLVNITEAIDTSVGAPLTVASSISRLENPEQARSYFQGADVLTEIMERQSFHAILLRLTKGPNEFLGRGSNEFAEHGTSRFYSFDSGAGGLSVQDAFNVKNGRVVGLSSAYAIAAERRRTDLRKRTPAKTYPHASNDSSGCPVRHSFEDAYGNPQASLVLTGNKFTVAALRHAEKLPL